MAEDGEMNRAAEEPGLLGALALRNLAEREGFEPPVAFDYARFPGVCLKPLSHLSNRLLSTT